MAASWVLPVNLLVNVSVVGGLYAGEAAINFGNRLFAIASGVFILSVGNVILPKLSRQAANGDVEDFKSSLQGIVRVLLFFLLPLTFGMIALSQPLVQFILGGGLFGDASVEVTARAFMFFSVGTIGYGLQVVLCRACFAQKDGRTPMIAAIVSILVNGVLSFALLGIGIAGPALASTIGITLGSGVMVVLLTRQGYLVWPRALIWDIIKMALLAMLMFITIIFVLGRLSESAVLLQVLVPAGAGIVLYFGGCVLFKFKELDFLRRGKGNVTS